MKIFLILCILSALYPTYFSEPLPWNKIKRRKYDYVVVGGGAAGCVVAARLSENPNVTVLLIEAGPDDTKDPLVAVPRTFLSVISSYDWGFKTEPQKFTGDNRVMSLSQGKILGGSSSHNGMNIVRGSRYDFDRWAEMGNKGWGYDDVLPYFKKSEDMLNETLAKSSYHGTGGPMQIKMNHRDPVIGEIIKAGEELGLPEIDHNGPNQDGIALMQNNVNKQGKRHHPPEAFLRPVMGRRNLFVVLEATVTEVVINKCKNPKICKAKAEGVWVFKNGLHSLIKAKKEVIISAGAINSPRLLLVSGVGPKADLKKLKIKVKADLPVGEGLQDHYRIPFSFFLAENTTFDILKINTFESLFEYVFSGTGPWAGYGSQCSAFLHTSIQPKEDKFHYVEVAVVNNVAFFPRSVSDAIKNGDLKSSMAKNMQMKEQSERSHGVSAAVVHNHPRTFGKIELRSKFFFELPKITRHFFEDPRDIQDLIEGIRFLKKWLSVKSLASGGIDPDLGKHGCPDSSIKYDTDEYWACYIRTSASPFFHFTSSCRMSPDETGVVDDKLRVKGFKNLRVVDASIMPNVVSGHVMAATIMLAEKGSDLIKDDMPNYNP